MLRDDDRIDPLRTVVLVGGGHAHVQVLEALAERPLPRARVVVVVDTPIAVYSGMVPGYLAGQYRHEELEIDVRPLAQRAGATCTVRRVVGIDPQAGSLELEDGTWLPYDFASFDIGSTVAGLGLPGVAEYALHTRPIGRFVDSAGRWIDAAAGHDPPQPLRIVVVGAGAGGIEVAFCLRERLVTTARADPRVTLLQRAEQILPGYPSSLVRRALAKASAKKIQVLCGHGVASVSRDSVELEAGERLEYDLLLWVAGAVAQRNFDPGELATDDRGFLWIRSTLQVQGHDDLFAVGDCATLREFPETPKAGVYAVRQGPVLTHNLRAALEGLPLRRYVPQRDFLMLLNLGDGTALGTKWGRSFEGRWVMRLKDRIDRAFMRRFQG